MFWARSSKNTMRNAGIGFGEMFDMGAVGVGEGVERQAFCRALKQWCDARHFARKNRVPSLEKLGIRQLDAQRRAQTGKEFGVADLSRLMAPVDFVARKPPDEMRGLATGVTGPALKRLVEVDIEHDAAEIEQQRVGGAGGEQGSGHRRRFTKIGEAEQQCGDVRFGGAPRRRESSVEEDST